MTINLSDNIPRQEYTVAQGVTQTAFVVSFEWFDDIDLNVYVNGVLQTLTTDYTTAADAANTLDHVSGSDGYVHFVEDVTGISGGTTVVITRSIDIERTTDFPSSGAFQIDALNVGLDKIIGMTADNNSISNRSLRLKDYDVTSTDMTIPVKADRVGRVLGFNETTGQPQAGPEIADVESLAAVTADIARLADIEDGTLATDAIQTVAGISGNVSTVAGISGNVTTVAGNTTNINAVAGDATDIGTVATNIANVNTVAGINSDVTTVAGIAADVTAAATNASDITTIADEVAKVITVANDLNEAVSEIDTVANSITNVDLVGANITSVVNAANNLSSINNFGDTYFVSATAPSSPTLGDLWFDTANELMKVYSSSGWVNTGLSINGTANRYSWTVGTASGGYTGSTTVFPATYDVGYVDVYKNGVKLLVGTDVTATNGTDVTLATAAATDDIVEIIGYGTFDLLATDLGDLSNVTTAGVTSGEFLKYDGTNWVPDSVPSGVGGATGVSFDDNVKAQFGASNDLQIYHDGSNSFVNDTGTGNLVLRGANVSIQDASANNQVFVNNGGAVDIRYAGSAKLATTATGVDVTGGISLSASDPRLDFTDTDNSLIASISANNGNLTYQTHNANRDHIFNNGNVGIGTSPISNEKLRLKQSTDSSIGGLAIESSDSYGAFMGREAGSTGAFTIRNNGSDTLSIKSGLVGIGTASPNTYGGKLNITDGSVGGETTLVVANNNANQFVRVGINSDVAQIAYDNADSLAFGIATDSTTSGLTTEHMRLTSAGDLLLGTVDTTVYNNSAGTSADDGINIRNDGKLDAARYSGIVLGLNRTGTDGTLAEFRKNGGVVGAIGVVGGDLYIASSDTGHEGLRLGNGAIIPVDSAGASTNAASNIGGATSRFKDLYLSGSAYVGVIAAAAQSEHFIFAESDFQTYPLYVANKRNFKASGFLSSAAERGGINGSGTFPDGKASIVAVSGTANPGGSYFTIHTLGNASAGNAGFTTLSWSNEDGTVTGSMTRANMSYTSRTPSSTERWERRWQMSNSSTYTGTHPKNIIDDGYIKLTFS